MAKVEQDKIPAAAQPDNSGELESLRAQIRELQAKQESQGMIPAAPGRSGLDLTARSVGKADVNATTSGTDRAPDGAHLPQVDGPLRGDRREFLPAEYPRSREMLGADNKMVKIEMRRRDR